MDIKDHAAQIVRQDTLPVGAGGMVAGFCKYTESFDFSAATEFVQQLGIWFGTALVMLTFFHRIYMIHKGGKDDA